MSGGGRGLLGGTLLVFLVAADIWTPGASAWSSLRVPLFGVVVLSSLVIVWKRPQLTAGLIRPPILFFGIFGVLCLAAAPVADAPRLALKYATGYLAATVVAVAAAGVLSESALVRGLLATLLLKVAASAALAGSALAWGLPGPRFQGILGSPNPMGAAAGLTYVLLMLYAWYAWPARGTRVAVLAVGAASMVVLSSAHSASALVATLTALAISAPLGRLRDQNWRGRLLWTAAAVALMLVLVAPERGVPLSARQQPVETSLHQRVRWWSMLVPAVLARPWLGYGAGGTAALQFPDEPIWGTSAHNLYLEAALYAGIPAAGAMLLFVGTAVFLGIVGAARARNAERSALAAVLLFYAVLSAGEPVILNGAPSTLLVPLLAAAACARGDDGRERR